MRERPQPRLYLRWLVLQVAANRAGAGAGAPSGPVTASNFVSHENSAFDGTGVGMKLGMDGRLYLWSSSYVMRINADGTGKEGTDALSDGPGGVITGITANADGLIGASVAHFASRITVATPSFGAIGFTSDFFDGDTRWRDPSDVAVGAISGDFYGMDLYRNQVVRVSKTSGEQVNTFQISSAGNYSRMSGVTFGVCESAKLFIVHDLKANNVSAVAFGDRLLWSLPSETLHMHVDPETCAVYTLIARNITVIDGKTGIVKESFALQGLQGAARHVQSIAANATHVFIKVMSPVELFRVFDRASGSLLSSVRANVDQISLGLRSVQQAGATATLNVSFVAGETAGNSEAPKLAVWIRRLHTPDWSPLPWTEAAPAVTLPAQSGLYQIRATPGIRGATSRYQIDTLVELRVPNSVGTVSIVSPGCRYYWSAGERMNLSAILRHNGSAAMPSSLPVVIITDEANPKVVATGTIALSDGRGSWVVPAAASSVLAPGKYLASVAASFLAPNKLSVCPQPMSVGPAFERPGFKITQYGDYMMAYPTAETGSYAKNPATGEPSVGPYMTTAEAVDAHLKYSKKMGTNMYVDRLGTASGDKIGLVSSMLSPPADFLTRVEADNASVAVESLVQPDVIPRTVPGYGSYGIEQRAILVNMDGGLPVGTDFDKRTGAQFGHDIVDVTSKLMTSPAFTGWSWAANWWIGKRFGCVALKDPAQIAACDDALTAAQSNGTWNTLLDRQADAWLKYAVDAEKQFRANCSTVMPAAISGMTGPFRQPGVIPPIWYENADEIDLHYQSEEIAPPQTAAFNLEYQARPGKPNFAHYEMHNEDGTGIFAMNNQLQLLMRASKGVGWSDNFYNSEYPTDPRGGTNGIVGAFRAFNNAILKDYAPFFAGLTKTDHVAIVVSRRMLNIDGLPFQVGHGKIGGKYFDQLWEAWNAFFYAGMPASFVFSDDLPRYGAKGLTGFKAVVVVGQSVETDVPLLAALSAAVRANVHVAYDQTTQAVAGMPAGARLLPIAFNFTDSDGAQSVWQDDSAYQRFQDHFVLAAEKLRDNLLTVVKPATESGNREVLMSTLHPAETLGEWGRAVWVYNNQLLGLSPGVVWRVTNIMNQRIPQTVCVNLGAKPGEVVYDVFAHRELAATGNCTVADLRNLPGRMFAILPNKLTGVTVAAVHVEGVVSISVSVQGSKTLVPARLTVSAANGTVVYERAIAVGASGWNGNYTVPVNPLADTFNVQATELFSGLVGSAETGSSSGSNVSPTRTHSPPDTSFGQHFKAVAASKDGKTVVLNALNIDENLFGIDTATGGVKWRRRLGHYWAYSPATAADGATFTAQGFDLLTSEGMQMYTGIDANTGDVARRFSLPAYPDRACMWAFAFMLEEAYHHAFVSGKGWVAAAGDMALSVWSDSGEPLWNDKWVGEKRQYIYLVALGPSTLVVVHPTELTVAAYAAKTGTQVWSLQPALSGELLGAVASGDGSTLVVFGTTGTFVIRAGKVVHEISVVAEFVAVSDDGSAMAVTTLGAPARWKAEKMAKIIECYSIGETWQLLWVDRASEYIRNPTFGTASAGGNLVVAYGSDLGELFVVDVKTGKLLFEDDLGSNAAFAFLADGTLVAATWMGRVVAFAPLTFAVKWSTLVRSTVEGFADELLAPDTTPTAKLALSNADTTPFADNLLNTSRAIIYMAHTPCKHAQAPCDPIPWLHPVSMLTDNNLTAPGSVWLEWSLLEMVDSGWEQDLDLFVDGWRSLFHITSVAFAEDPNMPSSWLHDMRLESWNRTSEQWQLHQYLVADSSIHVHHLNPPLVASKIRITKANPSGTNAMWPVGNVGLAEFALLGKNLGCSAPDVQAKHAVAVMYDEDPTDMNAAFKTGENVAWEIVYGSALAYSGDQAIGMTSAMPVMEPAFGPVFGASVANFCFHVVERPQPGQFRWLQFAWRAMTPKTTGIALWVGQVGFESMIGFVVGDAPKAPQAERTRVKLGAAVGGQGWTVVRQDLWLLANTSYPNGVASFNITATAFGSVGGGGSFDQLLLCATEADCANTKPLPH